MTVERLINILQRLPGSLEVAVYSEMDEGSDMASKVEIHTKKTGPYNNGDDVWFRYRYSEDKQIVFIR
jgi:hypothetical protein